MGFLGAALSGALVLSACDTGLQGKLNQKRDERYEKAKQAVYAVENERMDVLAKALPAADAPFDGDEHPLLVWRKKLLDRRDDKRLVDLSGHAKPTEAMTRDAVVGCAEGAGKRDRINEEELARLDLDTIKGKVADEAFNTCLDQKMVGAKGTPSQTAAELGAIYIREQQQYWTNAGTMSRYSMALNNWFKEVEKAKVAQDERQAELAKDPKTAEDAKAEGFVEPPFVNEAHFDQVFMHAVKYFNLSKLAERSQSYASTMADYEIAFDFPGRGFGKESFSDYVSRACFMQPTLKERCKGVPHEYRASIIDYAYLEWLQAQAQALKLPADGPTKVLKEVNDRIVAAVTEALKVRPESKEEPVYPSTYAEVSGMSGVEALFSNEQGVLFNGAKMADKFGGALPDKYNDQVKAALDELKNTPGVKVDFQRIVLRMPGDTAFGTVVQAIKSFPSDTIKQVFLVGRRRVDDSMRLAALPMRLPRADDSQTISYNFKEDGDKKTTCNFLGVLGDPMVGKRDEFYIAIDKNKIRATKVVTPDPDPAKPDVIPEKQPSETLDLGSPSDLTKLAAFLDANKGRFRTFISGKWSYTEAVELVSSMLYVCEDEELVAPKMDPMTRKCGKVKGREMTLILGVCE